MKKIISTILLLQNFFISADIFDSFGFGPQKSNFNVVIGADKAHEDLTHLKNSLELLQNDDVVSSEELLSQSEKYKKQIEIVEGGKFGDNQYTNKLIMSLKSTLQIITAIRSLKKEWIALVKQHIELLQDSLKAVENLEQDIFKKKSLYAFEDLQELEASIAYQQEKLSNELSKKKEIILDIETLQKKIISNEKNYKDKVREQTEFSKEVKTGERYVRIKSELLDSEVILANYEKDFCSLKIKEKEARLSYSKDLILLEERKLQMLKKKFDFVVRVALRIDNEDLFQTQEKLKEEKQNYLTNEQNASQALEALVIEEDNLKKEVNQLKESYKEQGKDIENIDEWIAKPYSIESLSVLAQLGFKNDELLSCQSSIFLIQAQIELDRVAFKEKELTAEMMTSWYKIKHQKFKTREELLFEIKKYEDLTSEFIRNQAISQEKRLLATSQLNIQNHALVNINVHYEALQKKQHGIIGVDEKKFEQLFDLFDKSKKMITKQVENAGKIIEMYSKIMLLLNTSVKQSESMVAELQRVSLWQRSRGAISWEGIKNIFPDINNFLMDFKALGSHFLFTSFAAQELMDALMLHPLQIILWFLKLLFLFLIFLLFSYMLPYCAQHLLNTHRDYRGMYVIGRVSGFLCDFLYNFRLSFFVWMVCFYYVEYVGLSELFPSMFFYFFSIFYLLFVAHALVRSFIAFNINNKYDILNESFQPRFAIIFSSFLYATIIIVCFREAFLLGSYAQSEVSNILLALYSIIIRGLLLAFIRKEDLLTIIPSRTPFWAWIWNGVNNYYYSLLSLFIILMILSDPHIGGYDNLMAYLFWGILGTILVIQSLILFYGFVRRISVSLFFSSEREVLKERFYLAKTTYSFIAILLLVFFIFLGLWLILWFWAKPISLTSFIDFFTQPMLLIGFKDGQFQQKLSVLDVLYTFSFIPLSFAVAAFIDRFVLYRLFGMLLVDPGVHNTVSTITYYVTVLLVITLGLLHQGFGFLVVYYLGPLLFGLAWALRDVFNDFVAYFILLVQQPLKVGDYIKLDEDTQGIVRRITPRCVVLRRQNSFSIIVPNSKMMTSMIANWDYSKSFIAFPDIVVSVRYFEDPEQVRILLFEALDQTNNILKNPVPVIRLEDFGVNGFVFLVRGFISSEKTLEQWDIASNVRFAIVKKLRKHGMDLSFPVQIVHLKN